MQRDQFEHQHAANTIEMRGSNSTFLLKPLKRQHSSSKCCKQQGEHTKRKKNMVEENLIFPQIASKCFTSWNSQETQENQGSVTKWGPEVWRSPAFQARPEKMVAVRDDPALRLGAEMCWTTKLTRLISDVARSWTNIVH